MHPVTTVPSLRPAITFGWVQGLLTGQLEGWTATIEVSDPSEDGLVLRGLFVGLARDGVEVKVRLSRRDILRHGGTLDRVVRDLLCNMQRWWWSNYALQMTAWLHGAPEGLADESLDHGEPVILDWLRERGVDEAWCQRREQLSFGRPSIARG